MVRQVMPDLSRKENVIILCDSWNVKKDLVSIVDEYPNLDLIGNARSDSMIYDLPLHQLVKEVGRQCTGAVCPLDRTSSFPTGRLVVTIRAAVVS